MTVKMNGYTVEVKAKGVYGCKFNMVDTREFLNELNNILCLAKERAENTALGSLVDEISKTQNNIVEVLLKNGFDRHRIL